MNINILEKVPLAPLTTMKTGGVARFFVKMRSTEELLEAINFAREQNIPFFVLGEGSNTLFSDTEYPGLVIKNDIVGVVYDGNRVIAGAGVSWDELVQDVVLHNLYGAENLSLVPGSVGGAVVQNIGAYGKEIKEIIFSVDAFDTETMQIKTFLRDECEFGYRESIFKKNKNLIVVRVTFLFAKNGTLHIDYEDVRKFFLEHQMDVSAVSLSAMRNAIIHIRTQKMPAPGVGTAGSFFKNPVVSIAQYDVLKTRFPEIKAYLQGDNTVKLSAAWLLDHVGGWRGVRRGAAGVHEKQSLILVNHGGATTNEIISLANDMKESINKKANIILEEEVVIV